MSNYSISTDDGKTYSQMEIEEILSSFERLCKTTENAEEEIGLYDSDWDDGLMKAAECDVNYDRGKRGVKRKSTIKIEEAIEFLEANGTYEMALFVSLMFHRILEDRMPQRMKEKLDLTVRRLRSNRIVPITYNYYGEGSIGINTINKVEHLNTKYGKGRFK